MNKLVYCVHFRTLYNLRVDFRDCRCRGKADPFQRYINFSCLRACDGVFVPLPTTPLSVIYLMYFQRYIQYNTTHRSHGVDVPLSLPTDNLSRPARRALSLWHHAYALRCQILTSSPPTFPPYVFPPTNQSFII